ncbi:Hypothetical predicted protein [Podarcis lilfordi]|uniref:Uncharacterized protein n=1 Tax=Podarcis lilfordi TaxID=74358 RepID=A0AA35KJ35_9SAUR|nr:Hypothetical predicted protein [Podarcis lilfordi]
MISVLFTEGEEEQTGSQHGRGSARDREEKVSSAPPPPALGFAPKGDGGLLSPRAPLTRARRLLRNRSAPSLRSASQAQLVVLSNNRLLDTKGFHTSS